MNKIFKQFVLVISLLFLSQANAQMLEGGVSMSDRVPKELFGTWRVEAVCTQTNNKEFLGQKSVDIWVFSKINDIIILTNPVSGATASIGVNDVQGKTVKFVKTTNSREEMSEETPILTVSEDEFDGVDIIKIQIFSDRKLAKQDYIEYKVKGKKISGASVAEIFGRR